MAKKQVMSFSNAFITGYTKTMNLYPTYDWPNISESEKKDCDALKRDWENVGDTITKENGMQKGVRF